LYARFLRVSTKKIRVGSARERRLDTTVLAVIIRS
jgi:hypothetical protein